MGIVLKQSFKNTLFIYLGFAFGGINTLFLYTRFLEDEYYGLVTFLLSSSNLLMPLIALGIHHTIVKFFSSYYTKVEKDKFLSSILFLPLLVALPMGFLGNVFYEQISSYLSEENPIIKDYTFVIYLIAFTCAYFEVFYAWAKVQFQSVFGNILKELWNRAVVMILLFAVYFEFITKAEFIYYLTGAYFLRMFVMMLYAFRLYFPKFTFSRPENFNEIMRYSIYIILAGSAGAIILDIDKFMIPGKESLEKAAYYSVAVFIGSFIEAPSRAMLNILQPLTSKTLNEENHAEVASLYKKSSINLLLISGFFFVLINTNVQQLFNLLPQEYAGGALVVLMISLLKMYNGFLGNNGAIINNSKYYRVTLPFSVGMALSVYFLNRLFYYDLEMGTDGLALATLIVIFTANTGKILFVKSKFSMTPFTNKSFIMILIIALMYLGFNFWDFNVPEVYLFKFPIHPIINIALKSIIITLLYFYIIIKFNISNDITRLYNRFTKSNQ
ncbi:lipopolysaccharide biosynthesis protein [Polaribacter dokdonensis]|uniref:Membrane protein involved in the export of O-antigen and teichoic acid n=1 Tax=Polaribacter dokdonensis DSW-5 TaxID=1300348 RepID=A0A0M9CEX4_9FLAO|nr:oligosaccharide flippase family protein [Polaribacter dokdonensis]KOY50525.1 Polysaccharide transporter [Polaribacter dokdonensis DSW-5]SEE60232.1 Membrane protein involved in the export of O-antigen and teichoic acid [Polaribacter dokdonensis DSW-5]